MEEEKHEINMKDTYKTKDGREVRVLCIDRRDNLYPVIALVFYKKENFESMECFTKHGRYNNTDTRSMFDLIRVPVKKTGWFYRFKSGNTSQVFNTKEDCRKNTGLGKDVDESQFFKVEWEE